MKLKLLPVVLVALLAFKPLKIHDNGGIDGNGNGNGKKVVNKSSSRVVQKDIKLKNTSVSSKEDKESLKSKELAALTGKSATTANLSLDAAEKVMLSTYLDLNEKNFEKPDLASFKAAYKGYFKLKQQGKIDKDILTIIDFTLSSTEKRMWVIDMKSGEIMFQTVVSHGKNSGNEYANDFSNRPESYKSSLGFYKTAETYSGKHGLSLRLDGLERGINDNARMRDIVIHGADYANENFIGSQGRLGRSLGCPALPMNNYKQIINFIKDESCLFIYHGKNSEYLSKSELIN